MSSFMPSSYQTFESDQALSAANPAGFENLLKILNPSQVKLTSNTRRAGGGLATNYQGSTQIS